MGKQVRVIKCVFLTADLVVFGTPVHGRACQFYLCMGARALHDLVSHVLHDFVACKLHLGIRS